jgi:tetratricopeptide (TPR) repeat protein
MRQLGAIFFIAIFVLGTVALAFSAQTATSPQTVAGTTPAPGSTVIQATVGIPSPTGGSAIEQIVAKADEAAAKNDWKTAAGFYKSAIALSSSSGNATLLFKYGKALGNSGDYAGGVGKLQEALDLNPSASFAGEAQQLIDTWKSKVTPGSNLQVRGTVTGTTTLTATSPMTK